MSPARRAMTTLVLSRQLPASWVHRLAAILDCPAHLAHVIWRHYAGEPHQLPARNAMRDGGGQRARELKHAPLQLDRQSSHLLNHLADHRCIHPRLLPCIVAETCGQVHPPILGAKRILEGVGLRYGVKASRGQNAKVLQEAQRLNGPMKVSHRRPQQRSRRLVQRAVPADLRRPHVRVGHQRRPGRAPRQPLALPFHPLADGRRRLAQLVAGEPLVPHPLHLCVDLETVQQWTEAASCGRFTIAGVQVHSWPWAPARKRA